MTNCSIDILHFAHVAAVSGTKRYAVLHFDDMKQEAIAAMLEAYPKFDAARGELEPYLMYAAWNALSVMYWRAGAVSQRCDRNDGWAYTNTFESEKQERIERSNRAEIRDELDPRLMNHNNPETLLMQAQLGRAVDAVLEKCARITRKVLLGEGACRTLALDVGEDPEEHAQQIRAARRKLRAVMNEYL